MRHTRMILPCLAVLLILAAGAVQAEEIVYFTNGNAMPIRSHEVRGSMIHVDLGSDAFMAFPLSMVEKVEVAGKEVVLDPSFSSNKVFSTAGPGGGGNFPVRGTEPSRYSDSKNKLPMEIAEEDPSVDYDGKMGVAVYRPYHNSNQAGKRALASAGHRRAGGSSERLGTRRVGNRHVIGGADPPGASRGKPPIVSLEPKSKASTPTPPPDSQDSADSGTTD